MKQFNVVRSRVGALPFVVLLASLSSPVPAFGQSAAPASSAVTTVAGMPPVPDPSNLYSETTAAKLSPAVAGDLHRVYVPHIQSNDVYVIDPATFQVVDKFKVGLNPQHVVPSWDLRTLVGGEQRGEHQARQPHARRPEDGQARQADRGGRSLQHVFFAGRQVGDRRRRGDEAPRLPRSENDAAAVLDRRSALRRHQSRRFFHRRQVRDLHLRIHRHRGQDRPGRAQGAGLRPDDPAGPADQDRQGVRTAGTRSSARHGRACRRTFAPPPTASSISSPT